MTKDTSKGIAEKKLIVNPYGVDLKDFTYNETLKDKSEVLNILFVGAFCVRKGAKTFLKIVDSLKNPITERPSRKRKAETKRKASVYIVMAITKNRQRHGYYDDEESDPEIVGVFYSKRAANQCAKNRVDLD